MNSEKTYPCPRCGKATTGTPMSSGCNWSICEDCAREDELTLHNSEKHRGETKGQHSA